MSLLTKSLFACAAIAVSAVGFCLSAKAAPITPGQTISAVSEPDPTGGTIISNGGNPLVSNFSGGAGPTAFAGTLISKVIQGDPSNTLGGLTFTFQLTNAQGSATPISRLTSDDYTGFLTDVSYQLGAGGTAPTSIDRNTAAVMGWTYNIIGNGQVNPGTSSAVMVIQTNAKAFNNVTANILGGAGATTASFGPVPEPASIGLLALGALAMFRRRRTA